MSYTHLTEDERYQIKDFLNDRLTQSEIARRLARDPATISRELRRNLGERGYRPKQAQNMASERQRNSHGKPRIAPEIWLEVEAQLRLEHSPEQICESRKSAGKESPSHERIYQHVYANKASGGVLYKHLRCQKARRKRYGGGRDRRGQIPNRRGISERPKIVEQRTRIGDWEADTVIGKQESQAIVTVVERKTGFLVARKVRRRTAENVRDAIIEEFSGIGVLVKTITFDNGKEFALHDDLAVAFDAKTYFADPYSSWQRGTNENTNGLLRQYIPKSVSLDEVSDADLQFYVDRINDRPRRRLNWKTPRQKLQAAAKRKGIALSI